MLVKNSVIYGGTTVIKGLFSFLRIAVFTRLLAPADYGDFAIVMSLVGFADAFGFQWIRQAIMRHITHEQTESDVGYLANALLMYGILSLFAAICATILLFAGGTGSDGFMLVFELLGLIIVTESVSNLMILMARLRLKHGLFFILNVTKPVFSLVLGILLINAGWGVSGALYGMLAAFCTSCLIGTFGTQDFRKFSPALVSKDTLRAVLSFGLPLIVVYSLQSAIKATDRVLLDILIGGDITGLYAAAQDIPFRLLNLLAMSIHLAAYPLAVRALDHDSEHACRAQLSTNFIYLSGIMIPASIGIAVLAPGLAAIFVGEAFRPFAVEHLGYFVAVSFINCMIQYYFVLSFNLAKRTKLLVLPFLCGAALNLLVGVFAIPVWGANAAIAGSFIAYSLVLIVMITFGRKAFPLPAPVKPLVQITLSSCIMGALVYMLNGQSDNIMLFIASIMAGIIIYAVLIYALNVSDIRTQAKTFLKQIRATS